MNELDDFWSQMLSQAKDTAQASGRHDVADYLKLKSANDEIRRVSVAWLFNSLIEIAGEANRQNTGISIEREDPHSFDNRGSNMVGSMLRVRHGVRCLTLEAGWARTPSDGFMRGGALAMARISHFGMPRSNIELLLLRANDVPAWVILKDENSTELFESESLREHFRIFVE